MEDRMEAIRQDTAAVLATPEGRRFVARILEQGYYGVTTLDVRSFEVSAFHEGMRAVAIMIANGVREVDVRLLSECEVELGEFEKRYG